MVDTNNSYTGFLGESKALEPLLYRRGKTRNIYYFTPTRLNMNDDQSVPEIDFGDLAPIEIRYRIGANSYILREASGDAVCKWRNAVLKSTKMVDGKPTALDGIADSEPLLVALCLFKVAEQPGSPTRSLPVSVAVVRSWPNRIQKSLFDKVKSISGLDEPETEEVLQKRLNETKSKLYALRGDIGNGDKDSPEEEWMDDDTAELPDHPSQPSNLHPSRTMHDGKDLQGSPAKNSPSAMTATSV